MAAYADLDAASQITALRPVAVAGAEQLGLEVAGLVAVHHGYNTTFRVRTTDRSPKTSAPILHVREDGCGRPAPGCDYSGRYTR